jgi:hypothetical protein
MIGEHWAWWLLVMGCVVWYSTITVYVAIKGAYDIVHMLRRLASQLPENGDDAGQ